MMRLRPVQGAPRSSWWHLILQSFSLLVCLWTASSIVCHPSAHHAQTGYIYYQRRAFVPRSTPRRRGAVCLSSESPRDHFANLLPPAAKARTVRGLRPVTRQGDAWRAVRLQPLQHKLGCPSPATAGAGRPRRRPYLSNVLSSHCSSSSSKLWPHLWYYH